MVIKKSVDYLPKLLRYRECFKVSLILSYYFINILLVFSILLYLDIFS